jgi:protein-tyrosine sulfotransferase
MANRRDVLKFIRYSLERKGFTPSSTIEAISERAVQAAYAVRGSDRAPAIIIHGVMPRSGTVYVGELLRLHPDLHAFPYNVWEFPFLQHASEVQTLEEEFLWSYEQNRDKIGSGDFLPLFGSALIRYLHGGTPAGKRMLLKVPSVQYLDRFHSVFPHEHLLVLVRDGRDVVQSTLKTWPQLRFSMVCIRWRRAARMVIACAKDFDRTSSGYMLARFENAVEDPAAFIAEVCRRLGLDAKSYPYDKIPGLSIRGSSTLQAGGQVTWVPQSRPDRFNPMGHWRQWSSYHKTMFKRIAGRELIELGYAKDSQW